MARGRATGYGGVGWDRDRSLADARLDEEYGLPPYMALTRGPGSWSRQTAPALDGTTFIELGTAENTARFDYDPVTGRTLVLVEPTRTNISPDSNFIDAGGNDIPDGWLIGAGAGGVDYNCVAGGPHGGLYFQIEDTAQATRGVYDDSGAIAALTLHQFSEWVRRTGTPGAASVRAFEDGAGTVTLDIGTGPYDWTRLFTSSTTAAAVPAPFKYMQTVGDPAGVVALVLQMLEAGDCASSYIPTAAGSATRAAELLTIDPSVVPRYRGTVSGLVRFDFPSTAALTVDPVIKCWANGYKLVYDPADDKVKVVVAGTKRAETAALSFARQSYLRWRVIYGASGQQLTVSLNGGAAATTSNSTAWGDPGALAPFLGSDAASANCRPMAHGDYRAAA